MLNYRAISGGEVLYTDGVMYFWMPFGVYSLNAASLRKHNHIHEPREVDLTFIDTQEGVESTTTIMYPQDFDDYEIIYRLISGTSACDCIRGQLQYGPERVFDCNNGQNRFVLHKMAIKGKPFDTVMTYRTFI